MNNNLVVVLACCLCFALGFVLGMKYEASRYESLRIDIRSPLFQLDSTSKSR